MESCWASCTWRVEPQSCRGWAICYEIHPEQLHRYEALRKPQSSCEEDGRYFTHIAADHVADESLHVVVDGPTFLNRSNLEQAILSTKLRILDPHVYVGVG